MKYTAEEVREWAAFAQAQGKLYAPMKGAHEPWEKLEAMLTAYADLLERIKADDGVAPDGWAKPEEIESYRRAAAKPRGTNGGGFGVFVSSKPGGIYTLPVYFTHPPAQAAQGEVFMHVLASLIAAVSLLRHGGRKAAPSDTMFAFMLSDYEKAIKAGRALLAAPQP